LNSNRTNISSPNNLHNINNTPKKDTNDSKRIEFTDEEAAVKIQSSFRGYKTREELRKHVFTF